MIHYLSELDIFLVSCFIVSLSAVIALELWKRNNR